MKSIPSTHLNLLMGIAKNSKVFHCPHHDPSHHRGDPTNVGGGMSKPRTEAKQEEEWGDGGGASHIAQETETEWSCGFPEWIEFQSLTGYCRPMEEVV